MTQYSYSRVDLFNNCPYHFKLRYIDKLTEIIDYSRADHPLLIGHALHTGIETNVETAINEYYKSFPVLTDRMVEEAMKLEILIPKAKKFLEETFPGCELIHEYKIDHDDFLGFVDLIVKAPDGTNAVIDFKYSNYIKNYMDSGQLHIYKDRLKQDGIEVEKLAYLFIPKTSIRQKQDENLFLFRKRLIQTVEESELTFVPIEFDEMQSVYFKNSVDKIEGAKDYPKNVTGDCFSCNPRFKPDYLEIIENYEGEEIMKLPSAQRRNIEKVDKRVFWLYGAPFSGKTTFVNDFPNPLMLNTDGNIRFVDAPYVKIANEVEVKGRQTVIKLAWDVFKDAIAELEKKDNDFKTIIVDLLEDTYEACRIYMYDKLGIEHEADNSFKAWDMVRTEYLSTIKRIIHLDYTNIIFLSHEDLTKDVTKKTGDKITAIKPNLQDKAALKVAGMVDIVGRVVADDEERKIEFKSKSYVFSGGRLPNLNVSEINLDVDELIEVYDQANKKLQDGKKTKKDDKPKRERKKKDEPVEDPVEDIENEETEPVEEKPKRERRSRKKEEPETESTDEDDSEETEEESKPRTRKRRERKAVDDTPPGESDDEIEKEEEKPTRRRRSRR